MAQHWRYTRITSFSHEATGRWRVYGDCINEAGRAYPNTYNCTTATPFSIWQECIAAGVPCCDPPYADLTLNIGDRWRVFSIMELRVSPHTGNSFIRCIGNRPDYGARYAVENTYYVTESPAAIRALCDAAGVPRPEEEPRVSFLVNYPPESWVLNAVTDISVSPDGDTVVTGTKPDGGACTFRTTLTPERVRAACEREGVPCPEEEPKTITIIGANSGDTFHLNDIHTIQALVDGVYGPRLCVDDLVASTPLADIRRQAEEAGMELPKPVVVLGTNNITHTFSAITRISIDASLHPHIAGKRVDHDRPDTGYGTDGATIPQVLALCALAGWPRPEVRCVFTYANGDPCPIDPENVDNVSATCTALERCTAVRLNRTVDGFLYRYVREPAPVVEAMRKACKEGE